MMFGWEGKPPKPTSCYSFAAQTCLVVVNLTHASGIVQFSSVQTDDLFLWTRAGSSETRIVASFRLTGQNTEIYAAI